jgi:adenosine kinase
MRFEGRFADSLLAGQLDRVSLSFLVEDLQIRRGGVAANICYGMAVLGRRPVLVGAVGEDFAEYRSWLERHGVDCSGVHVTPLHHTARFVCTTDRDLAQIASFYAGAMSEARNIELGPLAGDAPFDLVVISPNDPEAMRRHTEECRYRGVPFAADPTHQLAWSDGELIRALLDGAAYLFANDYEAGLIGQKTGWGPEELARRVGTQIITHGEKGVVITGHGEDLQIPAVPTGKVVDPTGVGDAFRAGFLAGRAWGLALVRCAQLGCGLATLALESTGPQEYRLDPADLLGRLAASYGDAAAAEIGSRLRAARS